VCLLRDRQTQWQTDTIFFFGNCHTRTRAHTHFHTHVCVLCSWTNAGRYGVGCDDVGFWICKHIHTHPHAQSTTRTHTHTHMHTHTLADMCVLCFWANTGRYGVTHDDIEFWKRTITHTHTHTLTYTHTHTHTHTHALTHMCVLFFLSKCRLVWRKVCHHWHNSRD